MPGYEDLTPDQIIYLMNLVVLICFIVLLTKVVPGILQYRSMKFIEVKITTKQCEENNALTLFRKLVNWIQERRKEKQPYRSYSYDGGRM